MSDKDKQGLLQKHETTIMWGLVIFAVVALVVVLGFYFARFYELKIVTKPEELGVFGDYVGGVLNPIFAFLAFLILMLSFRLQSKELRETKEELKKASDAQVQQAKLVEKQIQQIEKQNFESFFSKLLSHQTRIWNEYSSQNKNSLEFFSRYQILDSQHQFAAYEKIDEMRRLELCIEIILQIHEYIWSSDIDNKPSYVKLYIGLLSIEQKQMIVFYYLIMCSIMDFDASSSYHGSFTYLLKTNTVEKLRSVIEDNQLMGFCDKSQFHSFQRILRTTLDKKAWGNNWEFWRTDFFNEYD